MTLHLDPEICERARQARDARFDGRFFIGVKTTGVYCRPVCPVRQPKPQNVAFFPTAAAAAEAGFRPCLRCRPECSPGTPAWLGTSVTVSRALRLIASGALDEGSVEDLAARLGIGGRHLRRLFVEHLGATPTAVAQTQRLHFAKRLIDDTDLPMTEIALTAGFGSVRRFNGTFRATYGRAPTQLRREGHRVEKNGCDVLLRLPYRPPYNWDAIVGFLAARATPGVEAVDGSAYRRTITVSGATGTIDVRPAANGTSRTLPNCLELRVTFPDSRVLFGIVERVRRIFDLGADPQEIAKALGRHPQLRKALRKHPGLRVPGAWDGFEVAVRAILGQQVSVKGATTLAGRLARAFGTPTNSSDAALCTLFPTPAQLAGADVASIGLPTARSDAIKALAKAVRDGDVVLEPGIDRVVLTEQLLRLPGIGAWTAEYVAMRALGEPDAFPASDLGLLRAASANGRPLTHTQLGEMAQAWRPWRAYAAMYLWQSYAHANAQGAAKRRDDSRGGRAAKAAR